MLKDLINIKSINNMDKFDMALQWMPNTTRNINHKKKYSGNKNMTKIFEFRNSFIVINDIRSAIISPLGEMNGVIYDERDEITEQWYIKIIFRDDGIFRANFDTEQEARQVYIKLLHYIKGE